MHACMYGILGNLWMCLWQSVHATNGSKISPYLAADHIVKPIRAAVCSLADTCYYMYIVSWLSRSFLPLFVPVHFTMCMYFDEHAWWCIWNFHINSPLIEPCTCLKYYTHLSTDISQCIISHSMHVVIKHAFKLFCFLITVCMQFVEQNYTITANYFVSFVITDFGNMVR